MQTIRLKRYWLIHIYDNSGLKTDCFRVFTDLSLLLRSIQKHLRNEIAAHPTWSKSHRIWYICEEPVVFNDVTDVLTEEASHAVFSEKILKEEEPSAMPIFEAGTPLV